MRPLCSFYPMLLGLCQFHLWVSVQRVMCRRSSLSGCNRLTLTLLLSVGGTQVRGDLHYAAGPSTASRLNPRNLSTGSGQPGRMLGSCQIRDLSWDTPEHQERSHSWPLAGCAPPSSAPSGEPTIVLRGMTEPTAGGLAAPLPPQPHVISVGDAAVDMATAAFPRSNTFPTGMIRSLSGLAPMQVTGHCDPGEVPPGLTQPPEGMGQPSLGSSAAAQQWAANPPSFKATRLGCKPAMLPRAAVTNCWSHAGPVPGEWRCITCPDIAYRFSPVLKNHNEANPQDITSLHCPAHMAS